MVASLTCCPFLLLNSHFFCTTYDASIQGLCLSQLFTTTVTWLPEFTVARQRKWEKGVWKQWSSGKEVNVLSWEAISQCLLWEQSSVLPGPENCKLMLTVVLSSAIHVGHCPAATGWSWCEGQLHWIMLDFGYCHSLSLGSSRIILNSRMLSPYM